ncbi:isochorismatase family protein [Intrasporangium calvum]|uniref:Isochorismatase hydrolase n=1 Tax=Intrasporangium calvum (strain ATCC 23552 / DSM 43043 / JCM 3097 / NBRC 12989 / NCIMB 10167 / NRRL B-3866 / 7 KIP) TaxID=710696 RepID=E6SAR7_INTC7|nr:isochorismatase family protein [Intrasporangium calvum]ADU48340.1 isochorismatase hydrolase [Intrasporangium calvum DSM 43043]AXG13377.1 isochorismatase family protein [Intrasporangium calvum]
MTEVPNFDAGFAGTLRPGRRPAVLAIDLMRAYFDPASPLCLPSRDCLASAARVLAAARNNGVPVIHTRVAYAPDGRDGGVFVRKVPALKHLFGGGPMSELMPEVAPVEDELVVTKQYASAFFGTSLASTLVARGADTVVIVGVSTSGCVRASGVDAVQHGFLPLVVRDAVGDRTPETHDANLFDLQAKYAEVVDERTAVTYLEQER